MPKAAVNPEVVTSESGEPRKVRTVKGRRLRDEKEEFVLVDEPAAMDEEELEAAEIVLVRCQTCGAASPEEEWEESAGDCPSCGIGPSNPQTNVDDGPTLSEADLVIQSIQALGPEGPQYQIRVLHLPKFYEDGRTDTRAERRYCQSLRGADIRLDYLETVRARCQCECLPVGKEGAFVFEVFKLGGEDRGFKHRSTEFLTKPKPDAERVEATAPAPATPAAPPRSALGELTENLDTIKKIRDTLFPAAPVARQIESAAPASHEPVNPINTVKDSLGLLKELRELAPSGGDSSTVRDWTEGIATIGREFGIGTFINNLLVFGLKNAERKQAEEAAARAAKEGRPAPVEHPAAPAAPPPANQNVERPPSPAVPPPAQPAALLPGGFTLDQLPPPMRVALDAALTTLVNEIQTNEQSAEEDYNVDEATTALQEFVTAYPAAEPIFDQLLSQSSIKLVLFLANLKPEWSNLVELQCAAGVLDEVKGWWDETRHGPDEKLEVAGG
jgi:hypothetical protein